MLLRIFFSLLESIVIDVRISATALQMFAGIYRDFVGKSECGDFKFTGIFTEIASKLLLIKSTLMPVYNCHKPVFRPKMAIFRRE